VSTASLTALVTAITGLVAAAATLIGVIRHVTGPAHQDPPAPEPAAGDVKVIPSREEPPHS
jgi:hypothetical protein